MNNTPFNINAIMGQFQQFMQNPAGFLAQHRLNIPQGLQNNPAGAIQYLLNNGAMSQDQYNQLRQMAEQVQQNPQFMQMFGRR